MLICRAKNVVTLLLSVVICCWAASVVSAEDSASLAVQQQTKLATKGLDVAQQTGLGEVGLDIANLKDQLEKGLKIRRPEEFAFIAVVVSKVQSSQLPIARVKAAFRWAQKKRAKAPYYYFRFALKELAAEIGVDL